MPRRGCFVPKLCREIVTFRVRRALVTTFSKGGACCFLNESLAMIFHPVHANRTAFPMCAAHHQIFRVVRCQQLTSLKSLDAPWCKDDIMDMAILAVTSRNIVSLLGKSASMGLIAAWCYNSVLHGVTIVCDHPEDFASIEDFACTCFQPRLFRR